MPRKVAGSKQARWLKGLRLGVTAQARRRSEKRAPCNVHGRPLGCNEPNVYFLAIAICVAAVYRRFTSVQFTFRMKAST